MALTAERINELIKSMQDKKDHDILIENRVNLEIIKENQKDHERRLRAHDKAIASIYIILAGLIGFGSVTKAFGLW